MDATLALLLSLRLALPPVRPPERPADHWFGADKVKHFLLAGFAQSAGYAGLRVAGAPHGAAAAGAGGITISLAVVKELVDRRTYGHFSVRDLAWGAAGAGAAAALLSRTVR